MGKQKITLDILAGMMNKSFRALQIEMHEKFALIRKEMATKEDLAKVEYRLEALENKIDIATGNRLSHLEDDIRIIKTKLDL